MTAPRPPSPGPSSSDPRSPGLRLDQCLREVRSRAVALRDAGMPVFGLFVFVPSALMALLVPVTIGEDRSAQAMLAAYQLYAAANMHWLILSGFAAAYGSAAMLVLALHPDSPTIGEALSRAMPLAPGIFLVTIASNLLIAVGLTLFILPGVYLVGRLALAPVLLVAENRRNPVWALAQSWQRSRCATWTLSLLVSLLYLAGIGLGMIFGTVLGAVASLGGAEAGRGAALIGSAFVAAVTAYAILLARVAAWRQLSISGT